MPRARSGNVEWRGGVWKGHVWFPGPPRYRDWVPLEGIPATDREAAKAAALAAQEIVDQHGYVPNFRGETVNEWMAKKWLVLQAKKWPKSWTNDRSNWTNYIQPEIGILPMRGVTRDRGRALANKLDDLVGDEVISDKTARNIWHTATGMFDDATQSNGPGIAVLETNPFAGLQGPTKKSIKRDKQLLFPDEFVPLVGCADVPLLHARLYALAVYTQQRESEILGLEWRDIDLTHGKIEVHHQADFVRGDGSDVDNPTKSRRSRPIRIESELRPLLVAMQRETGGKGRMRLFPEPPPVTGEYGLAGSLRKHIALAKLEREALTADTRTSRWITFHDLRATGAVWRLKRNGPEDGLTDVMEDGGWAGLDVMKHYMRRARFMEGQPFPPLPKRLLGAKKSTGRKGPGKAQTGQRTQKTSGKQWAQQGLNL